MRTQIIIETRVFSLSDISEKEGLILRTLLNLNEVGIREKLNGDTAYWDDVIENAEAIAIGKNLCNKIMEMVDKD